MTKVSVFENGEAIADAGAALFSKLANESIEKTGRFVVALSGGTTPGLMYSVLASEYFNKKLDWKNIFVFWGDERMVPFNDDDNNSAMAKKSLLNHVPIPTENIFKVQVQLSPADAAKQYSKMLKAFFKSELPSFDLVLLGMGEDGHTASLFQGSLPSNDDIVISVQKPQDNSDRITFTPAIINNAKHILILISGSNKAVVLKKVIENKIKDQFPIQSITPRHGKLYWYADELATSLLSSKYKYVHTGD